MAKVKHSQEFPQLFRVFPSDLGWMAVIVVGETVVRLTFGHPSASSAKRAISPMTPMAPMKTETDLQRRLQAFALGKPDDFRDIRLDPGFLKPSTTDFQLRVLEQCRKIPYGSTVSYAELAAKAGFPRAARAVGNCMAANPIPLLIPCHRVVRSDGQPGSYSSPGGVVMKRRLLVLESEKLT